MEDVDLQVISFIQDTSTMCQTPIDTIESTIELLEKIETIEDLKAIREELESYTKNKDKISICFM